MYRISSKTDQAKIYSDHPGKGGVYKLHCLKAGDGNEFMSINRLLGSDSQGILYIGRTGPGRDRIGDLIKSTSPIRQSESHHAGIRYKRHAKLKEKFPYDRLCVTFIPSEDPALTERQHIQDYIKEFGEVPPLNANEA